MQKIKIGFMFILVFFTFSLLFSQDIFEAVRKNEITAVRSILEAKPEIVNSRDVTGRSAIQIAVLYGHADIVDILIRSGADMNTRDQFGKTPLLNALWSEEPKIAALLVASGAGASVIGEEGRAILHKAAWIGCREVVDWMAERGVDRRTLNDNGGTLLHSVVHGRMTDWLKRLLRDRWNVDAKDRYGLTPLHLAAMGGFDEAIEFLLGNGASIHARTAEGKTAFHLALENGRKESAELLGRRGADTHPPKFPVLRGEYFGQKKPGMKAALFAVGIVSTPEWEHGGPVFSPDGSEMYWSPVAYGNSQGCIMVSRRVNGQWELPVPANFTKKEYREMGPGLTPDGKRMYFTSYRPVDDSRKDIRQYNLWVTERTGRDWSEPRPLPTPVNNSVGTGRSTLTQGEALYFGSWQSGLGCIYRSQGTGGRWAEPELLPINSKFNQICSYVSPDDRFLIFESSQPGGFGGFDLYIAFRDSDGTWGPAVNLGERVNTPAQEWFASMSHDMKYLFFTSNRNGNDDIYWIDARFIADLKPGNPKSQ